MIIIGSSLLLFLFCFSCVPAQHPFSNYTLLDNRVRETTRGRFSLNIKNKVIKLKQVESVFDDDVDDVVVAVENEENHGNISFVQGTLIDLEFSGQFIEVDNLYYIEPARKYNLGSGGVLYNSREVISTGRNGNVAKTDNIPASLPMSKTFYRQINHGKGGKVNHRKRGNICELKITIDKHLYNKLGQNEREARSLIQRHVARLNHLYSQPYNRVEVNGQQIKFRVKNTDIYDENRCSKNLTGDFVACAPGSQWSNVRYTMGMSL